MQIGRLYPYCQAIALTKVLTLSYIQYKALDWLKKHAYTKNTRNSCLTMGYIIHYLTSDTDLILWPIQTTPLQRENL